MSLRQQALELALLGRLLQGPSHGYELRKHINAVFGYLHSVSYGSLYPALRRLTDQGLICDCGNGRPRLVQGRSRRVYHLTPAGEERLASDLANEESGAWADDDFGVRFTLFGMTAPPTRLRILRGRREHTRSRLAKIDSGHQPGQDSYTNELVRFARDSVARELDWLDRVIAAEATSIGEAVSSDAYPIKENN